MNARELWVLSFPLAFAASGCLGDDSTSVPTVDAGTDAGRPSCGVDADVLVAAAQPAWGGITGADVVGSICRSGVYAYLEWTTAASGSTSPYLLVLDTATGPTGDFVQYTTPSNAAGTDFGVGIGIASPTPGTYTSDAGCGGGTYCVVLPVPASVDCGDAGAPTTCPTGCELSGATSDPICAPIAPEQCYVVESPIDCTETSTTPYGSWSVTLTSVTAYGPADAGPGSDFVVHGTFSANVAGLDAGFGTASLTLNF